MKNHQILLAKSTVSMTIWTIAQSWGCWKTNPSRMDQPEIYSHRKRCTSTVAKSHRLHDIQRIGAQFGQGGLAEGSSPPFSQDQWESQWKDPPWTSWENSQFLHGFNSYIQWEISRILRQCTLFLALVWKYIPLHSPKKQAVYMVGTSNLGSWNGHW